MSLLKKYYEVHYQMSDENDEPVGRSIRTIYSLWIWGNPGDIFTDLKLEHGRDNFFIHSIRRL